MAFEERPSDWPWGESKRATANPRFLPYCPDLLAGAWIAFAAKLDWRRQDARAGAGVEIRQFESRMRPSGRDFLIRPRGFHFLIGFFDSFAIRQGHDRLLRPNAKDRLPVFQARPFFGPMTIKLIFNFLQRGLLSQAG
jgi:hypothetical protein